jgi:hypothetical protein
LILTDDDGARAAAFLPPKIEMVLGPHFAADTTTWQLLWRGSRDGFAASEFHGRCDNQGATITVVKSASGHVFGGVTSELWASRNDWVHTTRAFLYGIRTAGSPEVPVIFNLTGNPEKAMRDDGGRGPAFGGGNDLRIVSNANDANIQPDQQSFANLGATFTGNGITATNSGTGTAARLYFAGVGSENFIVDEIEVFKLATLWDSSRILSGDDGARAAVFLPREIEKVIGPQFAADTTTWQLLWRGSRDGFAPFQFHDRCDNQEATVTVMKTTAENGGYVFGGVTGESWASEVGPVSTTNAFLYGIRTHGSPELPVIFRATQNTSHAIVNRAVAGVQFGIGPDLDTVAVNNFGIVRSEGFCNLGHTYTGNGIDVNNSNTTAAREYFSGRFRFHLAEIEMFKLVPTPPWDSSLVLIGDDRVQATAFLPRKVEEVLGSEFAADNTTWQLLWRGSRDGFAASEFHRRCDNQGATITVVKSASGHVFGGVTAAPWTSAGEWVYSTRAFLYGIRTAGSPAIPVIFRATGNVDNALKDLAELGPTFGGGIGLYIATNANATADSSSHLGLTYTGHGITYGTKPSKSYFAGSHEFKVAEVEVFKVAPQAQLVVVQTTIETAVVSSAAPAISKLAVLAEPPAGTSKTIPTTVMAGPTTVVTATATITAVTETGAALGNGSSSASDDDGDHVGTSDKEAGSRRSGGIVAAVAIAAFLVLAMALVAGRRRWRQAKVVRSTVSDTHISGANTSPSITINRTFNNGAPASADRTSRSTSGDKVVQAVAVGSRSTARGGPATSRDLCTDESGYAIPVPVSAEAPLVVGSPSSPSSASVPSKDIVYATPVEHQLRPPLDADGYVDDATLQQGSKIGVYATPIAEPVGAGNTYAELSTGADKLRIPLDADGYVEDATLQQGSKVGVYATPIAEPVGAGNTYADFSSGADSSVGGSVVGAALYAEIDNEYDNEHVV